MAEQFSDTSYRLLAYNFCMTSARRAGALVVLALSLRCQLVGHANEGFWPFNRIPKAAIKQALGVDLSDQWIERVQQASVRFPSGSGSFVSPDGLVLTNHHVSLDLLHKMSTPERDLREQGFHRRRSQPGNEGRRPRADVAAEDRGRHREGQ